MKSRAERVLHDRSSVFTRKRRDVILELGEFVRELFGQQVAPRREHLPELDEHRSELFERSAQSYRVRSFGIRQPASGPNLEEPPQRGRYVAVDQLGGRHRRIEALAGSDASDFEHPVSHGSSAFCFCSADARGEPVDAQPQVLQTFEKCVHVALIEVLIRSTLLHGRTGTLDRGA